MQHYLYTSIFSFAGYKPGECGQTSEVILSLRILFAPAPICLLLMGMVMFYFYPINEKRRQEIQTELKKRYVFYVCASICVNSCTECVSHQTFDVNLILHNQVTDAFVSYLHI